MRIHHLTLQNFRCFKHKEFSFESPLVLIEGSNGVGKTSLLEALHYSCYIRSFRTSVPKELILHDHDSFIIKVSLEDSSTHHSIHIGYSCAKKMIKVDNKAITSFKELTEFYKVITITHEDIALVSQGPGARRLFLDQTLSLLDAEYLGMLKKLKIIAEQRSRLLLQRTIDYDYLASWTRQLWDVSEAIQAKRVVLLTDLEKLLQQLLREIGDDTITLSLAYAPKNMKRDDSWETFCQLPFLSMEQRYGRNLFGAHLDDFTIAYGAQNSRTYASRGQQKLTALLLRLAQARLASQLSSTPIIVIDDFLSEFDNDRVTQIMTMLSNEQRQIIISSPTPTGFIHDFMLSCGAQHITLTK